MANGLPIAESSVARRLHRGLHQAPFHDDSDVGGPNAAGRSDDDELAIVGNLDVVHDRRDPGLLTGVILDPYFNTHLHLSTALELPRLHLGRLSLCTRTDLPYHIDEFSPSF